MDAELTAALARFVAGERLPGAVAGVIRGGRLAWTGAAGFADLARRRPAEVSGIYPIASVTKPFTATAVLRLRDAGLLGLDDPAVRWLPELREMASPYGPVEAITIRRLLTHESGLPTEPPGTDWTVIAYQGDPARTLSRIDQVVPALPPASQHKYSDLGYQLLGEIVSRVSGLPYVRYLEDSVLRPLGLTATGFEPLPAELADRRPAGYLERSSSDELSPAPPMPAVWAEGGLASCVEDLGSWISFNIAAYGDDQPGATVVSAATLREMHRPRYLADDDWAQAWGLGWSGRRAGEVTWICHGGFIPGFTSAVCFEPSARVGAVVLANGSGMTISAAIALADIARQAELATPPVIQAPRRAPTAFAQLLGVYANPGLSWMVRLEWRDGTLAFTAPALAGWQLTLTPAEAPDVFVAGGGSTHAGDRITFLRLADGTVRGVRLFESTFDRLDPASSDRE